MPHPTAADMEDAAERVLYGTRVDSADMLRDSVVELLESFQVGLHLEERYPGAPELKVAETTEEWLVMVPLPYIAGTGLSCGDVEEMVGPSLRKQVRVEIDPGRNPVEL